MTACLLDPARVPLPLSHDETDGAEMDQTEDPSWDDREDRCRESVLWHLVAPDSQGVLHAASTPELLAAVIDVADHLHTAECFREVSP